MSSSTHRKRRPSREGSQTVLAVLVVMAIAGAVLFVAHRGGSSPKTSPSAAGHAAARTSKAAEADLEARSRMLVSRSLVDRVKRVAAAQDPNPDNPLRHRPWGVYKGALEPTWGPYASASGETKVLLWRIALTPKARWFTGRSSAGAVGAQVRDYIAASQAGNPRTLVQMALFGMRPWEARACHRLPSGSEQANYRAWIDQVARAIGDRTHAAVILQPDGPFAACAPHGSQLPSELINYAARTLSALRHTAVYIDAGAADWPADPGQGGAAAAVRFLIPDGIKYARGIALDSTHYSATADEVERAAEIVTLLQSEGIAGKKAVINTTNNGHPFVFGTYHGGDPDNATVCGSLAQAGTCVALGLPPTADVSNPKWGLPAATNELAAKYVDGYMWFGRPWLYRQATPYQMSRALELARVWHWG